MRLSQRAPELRAQCRRRGTLPMPLPRAVVLVATLLLLLLVPARSAPNGGGNERLLSIKCDPKRLQINVSADAAAGQLHLSSKLRNRATKALAACGVVVLKGAFAKAHIAELRKSAEDQLQEWFSTGLEPAGIDKRVEHTEFRDTPEVSCRSTGRWEVKVPLKPPWTQEETIRNPLVTDVLVQAMDSSRLEMDTYSVVTSLSQTPIQHWHRDAAALFEAPHSGDAAHPRPHGIVVFVPLDDVPEERGPTEFLLRSHIQCAANQQYEGKLDGGPDPALPAGSPRRTLLITECPHSFDAGTWKATAETGDAILFDLRILHRGGENISPRPRPQIYATYTRYLHICHECGSPCRALLSRVREWLLTCHRPLYDCVAENGMSTRSTSTQSKRASLTNFRRPAANSLRALITRPTLSRWST